MNFTALWSLRLTEGVPRLRALYLLAHLVYPSVGRERTLLGGLELTLNFTVLAIGVDRVGILHPVKRGVYRVGILHSIASTLWALSQSRLYPKVILDPRVF